MIGNMDLYNNFYAIEKQIAKAKEYEFEYDEANTYDNTDHNIAEHYEEKAYR